MKLPADHTPPLGDGETTTGHHASDASAPQLPSRDETIRRLEGLLPGFNSFDVIAWISLQNLSIDPEDYHEGENAGLGIRVEYLALLSLINGYQQGGGFIPPNEKHEQLLELLERICTDVFIESVQGEGESSGASDSALDMLADSVHTNEMFVRVPAYPHHHEIVLKGVFNPFDNELRSRLGFGVEDAIGLFRALRARLQRVLDERRELAHQAFVTLEKLAKRRRHGPVTHLPAGLTDEVLVDWSRIGNRDLRPAIRAARNATLMQDIGELLSFSAVELATESGLDTTTVNCFLEALSLDFGEVGIEFRHPRALHPLKSRPLIHHGERYLAPVPDQILWAFQPLFERTLLKSETRDRFARHRHDWLLDETCRLLSRMMPSLAVDKHLEYPKPDGLPGETAELDALGRYDSAVFLIEAKGASIREQGRMGRAYPFRDEIEKIIEKAHEQALRANRHLEISGQFRKPNGSTLDISLSDLTRVFLLAVTLEPLGHLTAKMGAENPFALSDDRELFTIGIHDLMAIADCLDGFPPWFANYISRRLRVARQGFMVSADELDLFCYYLERGLYHDGPHDFGEATHVFLGTWTDKLEEYYFYQEGIRTKPAARPRPKASPGLLRFVERLEASGLPHRLDAMLAIIDLSERARNDFLAYRERARKRHRQDGQPHDITLAAFGAAGWGITYATGSPDQLEALRLESYIQWKRQETRAPRWILVTETVGSQPTFQNIVVRGSPHYEGVRGRR